MYIMAFFLIILTVVVCIAIMFGSIIPQMIDSFALPFPFVSSMLGVNVYGKSSESNNVNSDKEGKTNNKPVCVDFWEISQVWKRENVLKIVHRFVQIVFTLGLLSLLYSKQQSDGSDGTKTAVVEILMLLVTLGGIIVIILELLGFKRIEVLMRNKLPKLLNVNATYVENRLNNRYGLIPYLGPIMSGFSGFLNQPPLMRNGKVHNWGAYIANFITYILYAGIVVCYEYRHKAGAIVLFVITALFAIYDVIQDVREVLNFYFGNLFFDGCKKQESTTDIEQPTREDVTSTAKHST